MHDVLVMCPTRGRRSEFLSLAHSMLRTTSRASLVAYVDEDDPTDYSHDLPRVEVVRGPRVGVVRACNEIARARDYLVCGMVPDDAEFMSMAWDEYVVGEATRAPGRVAVISPHHNLGVHVDMPFVTRRWVEATGWFAYPPNFHWAWPIITGLIGEMTAIVHAGEKDFSIRHRGLMSGSPEQMKDQDLREFFYFIALENTPDRMPHVVKRVREAMRG